MSKHTPGPWKVGAGAVFAPKEKSLSGLREICRPPEEWCDEAADKQAAQDAAWSANARLIAAAPELLGALKAVLEARAPFKVKPGESRLEASDRWHDMLEGAYGSARDAIAKAEGRE